MSEFIEFSYLVTFSVIHLVKKVLFYIMSSDRTFIAIG